MPDNMEQETTEQTEQVQDEPITFEGLVESLTETQRAAIDSHTAGLKSALESERNQRKDLNKQLREVAAKAEKGSELESQLSQLSTALERAELRASFYEEAAAPGIGCSNAKLAWIAANEVEAIDGRGRVNWETLKTQFPELFRTAIPKGNAGAGTSSPSPQQPSMNDFIRKASGRL